jgi:hypothetical protein
VSTSLASKVLQKNDIRLELTDDREYLADLMRRNKYNHLSDYGIQHYLNFVKYIWTGTTHGLTGGVLYFSLQPALQGWTFDAYKEDEKLKILDNKGDWGYKASLLVLDWFFRELIDDKVFAILDNRNRGAIWLAKKLGFTTTKVESGFMTLRKVR